MAPSKGHERERERRGARESAKRPRQDGEREGQAAAAGAPATRTRLSGGQLMPLTDIAAVEAGGVRRRWIAMCHAVMQALTSLAEAEAVGGADRQDPAEEMEEMVSKASMHMLSCTCTCCHAVHVMGGEPIRLWRSSGNRLGCGGGTGNRLGCGGAVGTD